MAQLCNKKNGLYFDVFDEEVAMAFSIYCGISIMHSIVYKKIQDAQARSKLSNELMMYHMQVKRNLLISSFSQFNARITLVSKTDRLIYAAISFQFDIIKLFFSEI